MKRNNVSRHYAKANKYDRSLNAKTDHILTMWSGGRIQEQCERKMYLTHLC